MMMIPADQISLTSSMSIPQITTPSIAHRPPSESDSIHLDSKPELRQPHVSLSQGPEFLPSSYFNQENDGDLITASTASTATLSTLALGSSFGSPRSSLDLGPMQAIHTTPSMYYNTGIRKTGSSGGLRRSRFQFL